MRLSVMANALKDQLADPQFQNMTFEDRLGLLVDEEWNARKNNHLNKLIRQATFSDPGACLENVEYLPDRGLKQEELLRFSTCNYIQEHHNIILLGATGSGKTYLACALGMAAVRRFYAVKYIRLPDLLVEFQIARGNGTIRKLMAQYKKYALLIIDEWLLSPRPLRFPFFRAGVNIFTLWCSHGTRQKPPLRLALPVCSIIRPLGKW